jgi:type I restriction enzyme S subunit
MRDKPSQLDGVIPWVRIEDFDGKFLGGSRSGQGVSRDTVNEMNLKVLPVGTVLCSCSCSMGATAIVAKPLVTNQTFIGIVPTQSLSSDYLYFLLSAAAEYLTSIGTGAIQTYLSRDDFRRMRIPSPPQEEQAILTAFLDQELAKIDALVNEQQRLIELLNEKRQAVISHAVLKGLTPNVSMKPSGIEWVGDIPKHWAVQPVRRVIAMPLSNGIFKKKEHFGTGVLLVNVFDIYQPSFEVDFEALDRVICEANERGAYEVLAGDLLFVRSSLKQEGIAAVAVAGQCSELVLFECHLIRARPNRRILEPRFASYVLNSVVYRSAMIAKAKVTTMTTIDQETILSTLLPIPPLVEQTAIVAFLEEETANLDRLALEAESAIQLLEERRTALISAAVTGKIDVRAFGSTEAA